MISVCSRDISPPIAASSRGSGSDVSATANTLEAAFVGFADPFACLGSVAGFSSRGYDLLGRLLRLFRISRKTIQAAITAPAIAQPTPIPAAAPLDRPFEDEDGSWLGFDDGLDEEPDA